MAGRQCYHCKQWIEDKRGRFCCSCTWMKVCSSRTGMMHARAHGARANLGKQDASASFAADAEEAPLLTAAHRPGDNPALLGLQEGTSGKCIFWSSTRVGG